MEKAADEEQICRIKIGNWKCKNVSGDNSLHYCEKHYNYYSDLTKKMEEEKKQKLLEEALDEEKFTPPDEQLRCRNDESELLTKMKKKKLLPPDEQRCSQTNGGTWRCKNFRMGLGDDDSLPKSSHCEKHYNFRLKYYQNFLKKRSAGCSAIGPRKRRRRGRRKVTEEDHRSLDVTGGIQPPTSDAIIERGTANIRRKRKNVETTEGSGELESLTRTWDPVVKSKSTLEHYKSKCFELSLELEKKKVEHEKMRVELEKKNAELENKKIECTKLQGELAEVVQTRKPAASEETERGLVDATQCWRKMFSVLESQFLRIENSNSTMAECVESPISKLGSLVLRSGIENSMLRFVDLRDSVRIESKAWRLQNDVTQSGEMQRDETNCGWREYSHVYELKTKEEILDMYENVEEGRSRGCCEERPSQLKLSCQDQLEMSKNPFANMVSDEDSGESLSESEDSYGSADSNTSLGGLMDMLEMKYRNRNESQKLNWEFEADMLSSFEVDIELNMKAVCALYRQHIAEIEISTNGLFHYSDAPRATTLAKFLMDGAFKGDLKKSVKELDKFDSKGVEDCKRLARSYSKQLFSIYQNGRDPFFLPAATASHGDQTAK